MPLVTAPNVIEQSDFSGGWSPDGEDPTTDVDTLLDVLNLLPDKNTGSLMVRRGFKRIREELSGISTHYVRNVTQFRSSSNNYLIVVLALATGAASANNVQLYYIKLSDGSTARFDTAGVTWDNPTSNHWGLGIDNVYYGGSRGNAMYSWDPAGSYNATAGTNASWKTVIDNTNDSVTVSTQRGRDFAFDGKEVIIYSGDHYKASRSIRFATFADDENTYLVGDRVSRWAVWGSVSGYWKSFRCIKRHNPTTVGSTSYPGTGATWKTYWTKVRLPLPSSQGETSPDWFFVPVAAETPIATWHADRLFQRYDDQGDRSRVLYSAPIKPDEGEDVPDTTWDPTDFAPSADEDGSGGGWIPFNDGTHNGFVTALRSYGSYLLVFKRQAVWVLTGVDDTTWSTRRVAAGVGCVGPNATVESGGLVYFLADDGLYVTDGTMVDQAPGNERVRDTLRIRMDTSLPSRADQEPCMWKFDEFIWFSIPDDSQSGSDRYHTYAYDPVTGSFWKTKLPVLDTAVYRHEGVTKLAFGAPVTYSVRDLVYVYGHASDGDADDTGVDTYATAAIAWLARGAWWPFSTLRAQRRIRRVWAVVRGIETFTLKTYRDWSDTAASTTARVVSTATPQHIEGVVIPDSHALSVEVSGTLRPSAVYGLAVHTQPRRVRYHSG